MVGKDLIMATLFGSGGGSSGSGGGGSGGGGSAAVSPKEVNFYDYDGTCDYAYTVAEAQALSELPSGPAHDGLVFQGWNWSLEGVKGLTRAMNIGAMYTTDDGTTRLYITLQEGRTSPMLGVCVNGTVTVDWGDGTEPDVLTGTSVNTTKWTPNHAYAAPGDYVIRLTVDGEMAFAGNSNTHAGAYILRHSSGTHGKNAAYANSLRRVEIGKGVELIKSYAFGDCYNVTSVTIPRGVTTIQSDAFKNAVLFTFIIIPDSVTQLNAAAAHPQFARGIVYHENTSSLLRLNNAYTLAIMEIPDSVTQIAANCLYNCYSLVRVVVPRNVTYVGGFAFYGSTNLDYIDFSACTAIPSCESNSFSTGVEIRVPAALYDEWIAATNWATYADYIKAY